MIPEEDEFKFDFDILDATKLIPEALVPVVRVGKMVLNRNPDNFFAETEQVAFHPGHIVPGLDFTNDPCFRAVCSPTPIRKSAVLAGLTSMKFRLTARFALTTIFSVRACTGWRLIPIRPTTSRTRSMTTGHGNPTGGKRRRL